MPLHEEIRARRKDCGLSQEKLAELMGVSRQAVAKWESGQSAPSTENLLRLADVLGTTAGGLLSSDGSSGQCKTEPCPMLAYIGQRRARRKNNAKAALCVAAAYAAIFLAGRLLCTRQESLSVMGWLFGTNPQQSTYLFGWLLTSHMFIISFAVCAAAAAFGKYRLAAAATAAFAAGLIAGETLGEYPQGAEYGMGHYGWLIWGVLFVLGLVSGAVWEYVLRRSAHKKSRSQAG